MGHLIALTQVPRIGMTAISATQRDRLTLLLLLRLNLQAINSGLCA